MPLEVDAGRSTLSPPPAVPRLCLLVRGLLALSTASLVCVSTAERGRRIAVGHLLAVDSGHSTPGTSADLYGDWRALRGYFAGQLTRLSRAAVCHQ